MSLNTAMGWGGGGERSALISVAVSWKIMTRNGNLWLLGARVPSIPISVCIIWSLA